MQILKLFLPFVLVFILVNGRSQNLVTNSSFESHDTCPYYWSQIYFANGWYSPTNGSPDYYNACSLGLNVPYAAFGIQYALQGDAFGGLYAAGLLIPAYREYIQSELIDTLKLNHIYNVSFFLNLGDDCDYAVDKMGAYLSDSAIYSNDTTYLPFIPQIESTNFLSDTANWMQINGYYQAHGGEKYITIGNFRSDSLTNTLHVNNFGNWFAYYYIDSVTVIDCTSTGIHELQQVYFTLLQNPVINSVCFTSPVQLQRATVYNLVGAAVKEQIFTVTNNYEIDVADLPKGIYFLQVETRDKRKAVRKFIKQ